jgi:flavin-dependent dehydrogenase
MARLKDAPQTCDVLVIGGGPAGSTISALLSEMGWDVAVLEKDRHPRFHIGESLLPRNVPIFERLGVLDDVARIAVKKYGADLAPPDGADYRKFTFAEANPALPNAFQVKRADFDALLLKNSAAKGARIVEGVRVTNVVFGEGRKAQVSAIDGEGAAQAWQADFVVDASGRDALLANRMKLKIRDGRHNSAAIFAHFSGVERRPGDDEGNTSVIVYDHGWFWTIPLADGNDSVGAVVSAEHMRSRRGPLDCFLMDNIASCPHLARRMAHATFASPVYAAGNYSYKAKAMYGDRFLLIGDAYAFLDPIFSTGVFLAMESAMRGAKVVDACLRDPAGGQRHLARHARIMERGLQRLAWFIYRFNDAAMQHLFLSSANPLRMRQAVVSLLAGDVFRERSSLIAVPAFKLAYHGLRLLGGAPRLLGSGPIKEVR